MDNSKEVMMFRKWFARSMTFVFLAVLTLAAVASLEGAVDYRSSKSTTAVSPTEVSPAEINAVPHPISESKPKRKYHKPPMVPPVDRATFVEKYDPSNPRHLRDEASTESRNLNTVEPCKSFIGITNTGWDPPDPHLAVGPNHIVEVVNSSIAIFDKATGALLMQTTAGFWYQGTVPPPPSGFIFDPKAIYDPVAGRFIILFLCTNDISQASYLVSVSQSSSAMGSWYNYNLDATVNGDEGSSGTWPDYPGLGFDYDEAVYITANMWMFNGGYQYVKVRILPKSELYSGSLMTFSDIWDIRYHDNSTVFTIKPATTYSDADGEFLLSNIWYGGNFTTYWKITDPLGYPVITRKPRVNIPSYPAPPQAAQQGGFGVGLIGSMTQEVTFRNGKVYTTFDQSFNWGTGAVSALRILGIDTTTSLATIDKVFGANQKYYYFPAIYVDPSNKIFVAYNRSASNEYIGFHYVEDLLNDPTSRLIKAGLGAHGGGAPVRWGDYGGIAPDGGDQDKVWFVEEYSPSSMFSWNTWLAQAPSKIGKPLLDSPEYATLVESPIALSWDISTAAGSYYLMVDDDSAFGSPEVDVVVDSNGYSISGLNDRTSYYWKVQGNSNCPGNLWSDVWRFKVCNYVAGDADSNGIVDISDAVLLIAYIFSGGPAPVPLAAGDANCDTVVDISDAVSLIAYIFSGGPAPCNAC